MLRETVVQGLSDQGLHVEEDRGGLLVRGGQGDHHVSIWVDETDRVVRAEEVLCYPVDDFSETLCMALDWLNQHRVGVTFTYQESQRALVASSVWTSPSRDPSKNQLHLLVALLHEAKDRDAGSLTRVSEGDASWEEVAEGAQSGGSRRQDAQTLRFTTSRYDVYEDGPASDAGSVQTWEEPPTRPLGRISDGSYGADEGYTGDGGTDLSESGTLEPHVRRTDRFSRDKVEAEEDEAPRERAAPAQREEVRRTSRMALQLAVSEVDSRQHDLQDLTVDSRSLGRRVVRGVFMLALFCGFVALAVMIVKPFLHGKYFTWEFYFPSGPVLSDAEKALAARNAMKPGKDLLLLELENPIESGSDQRIRASLLAVGEAGRDLLEAKLVGANTIAVRKRAYALWVSEGYKGVEGSRLALLKRLQPVMDKRTALVGYLNTDLQNKPPSDAAIAEALEWLPKGSPWNTLVQRLGRAEGDKKASAARAATLKKLLPQDTPECIVLRSLIMTGHGPPDAVGTLVNKRGLEWAQGAGREMLSAMVKKHPQSIDALFSGDSKKEVRLLGIDLLADAGTSQGVKRLIAIMKDSQNNSTWVRQKAIRALRKVASPAATLQLTWVLTRRREEKVIRREVREALRALPPKAAVKRLQKYLSLKQGAKYRRRAAQGLAALESQSAIDALFDQLKTERGTAERKGSVKNRLVILDLIKDLQRRKVLRNAKKALPVLHKVSQDDPSAQVREEARRLFRSLSGL